MSRSDRERKAANTLRYHTTGAIDQSAFLFGLNAGERTAEYEGSKRRCTVNTK